MEKHICMPENAEKFLAWLKTRGGLAIWHSIDLSDLGASWTSPVNDAEGKPVVKPHWKSDSKPSRIITDPAEVMVVKPKEIRRFHVALRIGSQGITLKCTDASTRKVRIACEKAGKGSWYEFDYSTQEAVIYAPDGEVSLVEFCEKQEASACVPI